MPTEIHHSNRNGSLGRKLDIIDVFLIGTRENLPLSLENKPHYQNGACQDFLRLYFVYSRFETVH